MRSSLTAIVVNHNRGAMLRRTVDSLRAQTRPPDAIVVVDNGSTDDSLDMVRGSDRLTIVALGENTGSSGGFSHGVDAAMRSGATELLLLDSDVVLADSCVARLSQALAAEPELGVVGPKVYHWDSRSLLQEFGGWIDWAAGDLRRSHWLHDEASAGGVKEDQDVDYVPACCLLTTRAAVEAAGNFDPLWFLYWDDIDWCARVRRAGLRVQAVAAASVQHFGGGANKRSLVPVYYGWRNRLGFFARFAPPDLRDSAVTAVLDDYLLARFTCESLRLEQTAAMMRRAVDDAMSGQRGRRNFLSWEIKLDAEVAVEPVVDRREAQSVFHIIGSATQELARAPKLVLEDRFGKRMAASRAFELKREFESQKPAAMQSLLRRALAIS